MTWEVLDFINEDYAVNEYGEVLKRSKNKLITTKAEKNGVVTCYIDRRKFRVSRLVAELFVPNPELNNFIAFKDGNTTNCHASNIIWVPSRKEAEFINKNGLKDTSDARSIRVAINDAIDANDWERAKTLGKLLNFGDEDGIRPTPDLYPTLPPDTRMPAQLSPVLRVTDLKTGNVKYLSTKEVTEVYGIKPSTVYKRYTQPHNYSREDYKLDIVALVPKTFINAKINVLRDKQVVATYSYTETCTKYNIHLEDLSDLLYSNDNDPIYYNGFEFRMSEGQKKIPVDYSRGE